MWVEYTQAADKYNDGEMVDAIKLWLECTEAVHGAVLMQPSLAPGESALPIGIGRAGKELAANVKHRLRQPLPLRDDYYGKDASYVGKTFTLKAKLADDTEGEVSVQVQDPKDIPQEKLDFGKLPCTPKVAKVTLTSGAEGLTVSVTCSEKVTDPELRAPKPYGPLKYAKGTELGPGAKVESSFDLSKLKGDMFVFQATGPDGERGSFTFKAEETTEVEVAKHSDQGVKQDVVSGDSPDKVETAPGGLPCTLEAKDVQTTDGGVGCEVSLSCTEEVRDAKLTLPAPYAAKEYVRIQQSSWVLDKDGLKDGTITFEGTVGGVSGSVSVTVELPAADEHAKPKQAEVSVKPGELPCELGIQDVALVGGATGFKITLKCSGEVTDGVLRYPEGYQDASYAGQEFAVDTLWTLAGPYDKTDFVGKAFVFEAKSNGSPGKTNEVVV